MHYVVATLPSPSRWHDVHEWPWWRHQMETFSALLANPPVTGGFPSQRPVTRSFDVFVDLHLNKQLSKQSRRQWIETPSRPLWRQCNAIRCTGSETKLTFIQYVPSYLIARRHGHVFRMALHNEGDWRMETWKRARRASRHVSISQSPSCVMPFWTHAKCHLAFISYLPMWIKAFSLLYHTFQCE